MSRLGPQVFWIGEHVVTDTARPTAQALLEKAWQRREHVQCGCQVPAPPMYITAMGSRYLVKRMPGTGEQHHRDCPSYQPYHPPFAGVDAGDPDRIVLRVALPSDRGPYRRAPRGSYAETVDTGRLGLAGLLAYLWHEAGLDAWSPKMEGKRHWGVVSWHLREAAHGKIMAGRPLSEQLYVPAPFHSARRHQHAQERRTAWENARRAGRVLIVIGEAKGIERATYGHRLLVKHLPDAPIYLDDDVHTRLLREQLDAVELIESDTSGHPMLIAAVSITPRGHARGREVALLMTTSEWLPYRAGLERGILADAVERRRRFTAACGRPAAVEGSAPTLVLADTAQPVAVHLSPPEHHLPGSPLWTWEPGKSWPAAQPPAPQRTSPAPTLPANPKEHMTHG